MTTTHRISLTTAAVVGALAVPAAAEAAVATTTVEAGKVVLRAEAGERGAVSLHLRRLVTVQPPMSSEPTDPSDEERQIGGELFDLRPATRALRLHSGRGLRLRVVLEGSNGARVELLDARGRRLASGRIPPERLAH